MRAFIIIGSILLLHSLHGQLKDNNFEAVHKGFSSEGKVKEQKQLKNQFQKNNTIQQKSMLNSSNVIKPNSKLFNKKSDMFKMHRDFSGGGKLYDNQVMQYPMKKFGMFGGNGKMSTVPNVKTLKEIVLYSKFKNSQVYGVPQKDVSEEIIQQIVDEISMKDINRYQFRRNRSADPDIPVKKAGGNWFESATKLIEK